MEMKYYNPTNHFKSPIKREPKPYFPPKQEEREVLIPKPVPIVREEPIQIEEKKETPSFFKDLDKDDLFILGLILLLILNACDDYLLLAALGYIFLSGKVVNA